MNQIFIFRTNGFYLGFLQAGNLFSRDGVYLGWLEGVFIWDASGQYRGQLVQIGGYYYILKNMYAVPPIPRVPRFATISPTLPPPPINGVPISPPIGYKDGFENGY